MWACSWSLTSNTQTKFSGTRKIQQAVFWKNPVPNCISTNPGCFRHQGLRRKMQISPELIALSPCKRVKEWSWRLGSVPTEQLQALSKPGVCSLPAEASYLINKTYNWGRCTINKFLIWTQLQFISLPGFGLSHLNKGNLLYLKQFERLEMSEAGRYD